MDYLSALPTFVLTLREGVEAALVVGIVMAYLKKSQQSYLKSWVYWAIGVGIAISAATGWLFQFIIQNLGTTNQQYSGAVEPALEAVFGVLAIVMLSWMLLWMNKHAKTLKQEVEGAVGDAVKAQTSAGGRVFGLVFFAILREGFETVLFIAAKVQQGIFPALGAISGVITATAIGMLIFKWGLRLNLRKFFSIMGMLLLLLMAGLVVTSLGRLDQAVNAVAQSSRSAQSMCFFYEHFAKPADKDCILGPMVWNLSKVLPEEQFPGVIFSTLFGYVQRLYLVQAISYIIFLLTLGSLYLQPSWFKKFKRKPPHSMVAR
jgi:high-affinity iron transporter